MITNVQEKELKELYKLAQDNTDQSLYQVNKETLLDAVFTEFVKLLKDNDYLFHKRIKCNENIHRLYKGKLFD